MKENLTKFVSKLALEQILALYTWGLLNKKF
jgi:hypothetical protein